MSAPIQPMRFKRGAQKRHLPASSSSIKPLRIQAVSNGPSIAMGGCFEWKAECSSWWCKPCRKFADDQHIASKPHQRKVANSPYADVASVTGALPGAAFEASYQETKRRKIDVLPAGAITDERVISQLTTDRTVLQASAKCFPRRGGQRHRQGSSSGNASTQLLRSKLKANDFAGASAAFQNLMTSNNGVPNQTLAASLLELLELAARSRSVGLAAYSEVLSWCVKLRVEINPTLFTKLLVILSHRVPTPASMIRLTLNLGLPNDHQPVPLIPEGVAADGIDALYEETDMWEAQEALSIVQPGELRGLVKGFRNTALQAYFGHFATLLHLETLYELQISHKRLQRPIEALERTGMTIRDLCVLDISTRPLSKVKSGSLPGRDAENKKTRIVFKLPSSTGATSMKMRSGDSVLISRTDPSQDLLAEGLVESGAPDDDDFGLSRPDTIIVSIDRYLDPGTAQRESWRLDRAANRTLYERQFLALMRLVTTRDDKRLLLWDLLTLTSVGGENVDAWATRMRDMLNQKHKDSLGVDVKPTTNTDVWLGGNKMTPAMQLSKLASLEPQLTDRQMLALQLARSMLQQDEGITELNQSQRRAVSAALGRRLTLVQGPPGTGKTTVSVQLLELWAKNMNLQPLLATSDSNIAVDNIAEGAHRLGLKVVRVGRPEKINATLEKITLENILRKRRDENAAKDSSLSKEESAGGKGNVWKEDKDWQKKKRVDEFEAKMAILRDADVICTTTIAAGSDFLHLLKFQAILIDEVAQATELSALVPIVLRGAERLVLVGDHCQLPPSVRCLEAELRGLSLSIFGRLAAQGLDPYFLDTQFRMHPMIAEFSALEFYHGKLQTGIAATDRPPPQGFEWPRPEIGITFLHVDEPEFRDGESRRNPSEVRIVMEVLTQVLLAGELSVLDIGVVSPYTAQVRAIRQMLTYQLPGRLQGTGADLTGGLEGKEARRALEVASVDGFQGREKDLIIFSAVRSNPHGNVGFLADWRRLNVMMTRARRGLVVIGNFETLRADPVWCRWLVWAEESGFVQQRSAADGPQSFRASTPDVASQTHSRPSTGSAPKNDDLEDALRLSMGFDVQGVQDYSTLSSASSQPNREHAAPNREQATLTQLAPRPKVRVGAPGQKSYPSAVPSFFDMLTRQTGLGP